MPGPCSPARRAWKPFLPRRIATKKKLRSSGVFPGLPCLRGRRSRERKRAAPSSTRQASAVPLLLSDLTTILDKLGKTSYSEAWQALAEIYYNHPFKSNDAAINFTRRAVACIPKGELRLSTYLSLAKMLQKRDWSASKRLSAIESNQDKFEKGKASNIERYSCYDGHYGPGGTAPWSSRALSQLSDREEAAAIVSYALRRYQLSSAHTPVDKEDYRQLQAFAKTL